MQFANLGSVLKRGRRSNSEKFVAANVQLENQADNAALGDFGLPYLSRAALRLIKSLGISSHHLMRPKFLSLALLAVLLALLYFPIRFAFAFQVFGNAVHSKSDGWLGPTPRNAGVCAVDIGKVNEWTCTDTAVFTNHRFGCKLWLRVFGYADA